MQRPFGHTLTFTLTFSRSWPSLGPGWAALAGALSTGYATLTVPQLLQLGVLWLLVDPLLGTLWDLSVRQGLWRTLVQAQLPPPPAQGFYLPYAQPGTPAGQVVLTWRRYRRWWRDTFWPEAGDRVMAFVLGLLLVLLIAFFLSPTLLALTLLTVALTFLAGQLGSALSAAEGGRLQAVVLLLLPWLMGSWLWAGPTSLSLALAICYWSIYLGGLRMLGQHRRAGTLFFMGQLGAIGLLLALRLLPGAAMLSVLFITQQVIRNKFNQPALFLPKVQPYLVVGILVAGLSLGSYHP